MRHALIVLSLVVSVLFLGVESAAEELVENHHAQCNHVEHSVNIDGLSSIESDDDQHHSTHCFHSHAVQISCASIAACYQTAANTYSYYEPSLDPFLQAPPTPPPTV